MRAILVVVHQATSDPGQVGRCLQQQGYRLDMRCPAVGDSLPQDLAAYDGVIIFGGPMSANDDDSLPFIRQELDWIPRVLDAEKPFLGICLGAQLLARVLGARVQPHPEGLREIGYFSLQPTAMGRTVFPQAMHVYHWHQEGFELPKGCDLLATGDRFPNQAFGLNDRYYGLQFHPEITAAMIDTWTTNGAEQLSLPGAQSRSRHFHHHQHYAQSVENWLQGFLQQWLSADQGCIDWELTA